MVTIIRKRAIHCLSWLILLAIVGFRAYSQRPVEAAAGAAVSKPPHSRVETSHLLISKAESHLKVREATGDNDGYWVGEFLKSTGLGEGYPWCAAFQSYIHIEAGIKAPRSARVVDWFKQPLWESKNTIYQPTIEPGMVGALYYPKLGRYGHIVLIVGQDKNNVYTIEGNTNSAGSREGDGVYRKTRSKKSIAALADYCVKK